jgi:hypothetical protein
VNANDKLEKNSIIQLVLGDGEGDGTPVIIPEELIIEEEAQ